MYCMRHCTAPPSPSASARGEGGAGGGGEGKHQLLYASKSSADAQLIVKTVGGPEEGGGERGKEKT